MVLVVLSDRSTKATEAAVRIGDFEVMQARIVNCNLALGRYVPPGKLGGERIRTFDADRRPSAHPCVPGRN